MSNPSWTRDESQLFPQKKSNTLKFAVAGFVMLAAVVFLVVNAVRGNAQLYKTVGEYYAEQSRLEGRDLRVAGWVIGSSIEYTQIDATTSRLEFDIVDDLNNPSQSLRVVAVNEPKPDLLQHEAQALVEGHAEGGVFMANEGGLFLKCPTRYEELEPVAGAQ